MIRQQKIGILKNDADIPGRNLTGSSGKLYLRSIQSNVGDIKKDVKSIIRNVCSVFRQLQTVWGSKVISLTVKL